MLESEVKANRVDHKRTKSGEFDVCDWRVTRGIVCACQLSSGDKNDAVRLEYGIDIQYSISRPELKYLAVCGHPL